MIRRIMLGVVTLAILIACYMLYTMFFVPPASEEPVATQPVEHTKIPPKVAGAPVRPVNFTKPEDAIMGGLGEKPYFERYVRNRLVYQFRADHWRPDDKLPGKYYLENPELNLCLRGGQVLRVSAMEGDIETLQTKSSKMEPQRGELRGRVHIAIDRATDPNRKDLVLRPEDTVNIWMDKVKFDLIQNIIESESPIKVESDEVELIGESLLISWNEVTNQIEEIMIRRGEKLVLRQGIDMFSPDMPFNDKAKKAGADQKAGSIRAGGKGKGKGIDAPMPAGMNLSRNRVAQSNLVYPAKETTTAPGEGPTTRKHRKATTQSTQPKGSRAYDLVFTSTVRILQYDKNKLTGKMNCDRLHLVFDVPRGSDTQSMSTRPAKATSRPTRADDGKRLEVFWEGPLHMLPTNLPYSTIRRFHIVATGQPVFIDQMEQGRVRCKKLTYHQESKQLWLDGTSDDPVNVSQGEARMIVAPHLFYDRQVGTASGKGPGFMQQMQATTQPAKEREAGLTALAGSDSTMQKMMVMWKEGFQLSFGDYDKVDPTTGQKTTKQFLKRAEFRGTASMRRTSELMSGDLVVINFMGPSIKDTKDSGSEKISMLHAERNVVLSSDQQQINCEWLDVEFGDGNFGRVPRVAKAKGKVKAQEGRRIIQADALTAIMEDKAIMPTTARSDNATPVVSAKNPKTKIVLREVDAGGSVSIVDPAQSVDIRTEKMHALIDPDGTLRWCYMEGSDGKAARAKLRDYDLSGNRITMDLTTEQVDIPGAGFLKFVNRQDLMGGEKVKATPIVIRWKDSMKMTGGAKNQGTFLGNVEVNSDRTTLFCSRMNIDFENMVIPEKVPQKSLADNLWVFSKLAKPADKNVSEIQMPLARKRPTYIQAFGDVGKQINVLYVVKDGAETTNRTTLNGKELTVDLITNKLNVPGEGQFFIEDYRLADKAKSGKSSEQKTSSIREIDDPFNADIQSSGPSQTAFTWKRGLVYLLDTRAAIFDGAVRMIHVSGPQVLAEKLGKPLPPGTPPPRQATLNCENLKVEFLRGGLGFTDQVQAGPASLKSIVATGSVHLQDKPRSVMAQRLLYNQTDKIIAVYGGDNSDAYLYEENTDTGQYSMWTGPWIMWDRKSNEIRCPNAAVITTLQ